MVHLPSLEGEAHGEDGAEEHRESDDEGEDDGVFTFDIQRSCEICETNSLMKSSFFAYFLNLGNYCAVPGCKVFSRSTFGWSKLLSA